MGNKTEGTGLVDDEGSIVKEIKEEFLYELPDNTWMWFELSKESRTEQSNVIDKKISYTNYQNDGLGCPTEEFGKNCAKEIINKHWPLVESELKKIVKKPKRAKIRRVK